MQFESSGRDGSRSLLPAGFKASRLPSRWNHRLLAGLFRCYRFPGLDLLVFFFVLFFLAFGSGAAGLALLVAFLLALTVAEGRFFVAFLLPVVGISFLIHSDYYAESNRPLPAVD